MSTSILKNVVYVGGASAAAFGAVTGDAEAQAPDGFYGGLSFGTAVASDVETDSFGPYSFDFGGSSAGAFAGYNMALGDNWFVGGELAYMHGLDLDVEGPFGIDPYGFADLENVFDARIRFGTVFDRATVYTAFGVTWASAPNMDSIKGGSDSVTTSGLNIGVGMEYDVTDRIFIGGDIVHRQLRSVDDNSADEFFPGGDATTVSIRAGFRF